MKKTLPSGLLLIFFSVGLFPDSQTSSQAASSDFRAASHLRDLNICYLNDSPDSQTVKFDFGHNIGAIDIQSPPVASLQPPSWPQKYANENIKRSSHLIHELNFMFETTSNDLKQPQNQHQNYV